MLSPEDAQKIIASPLMGDDDVKLGTVQEVLADRATGEPEWLLLAVGPYGETHRIVPAKEAALVKRVLHVPYGQDVVAAAPETASAQGTPSPAEAAQLYRHYGIERHD